MGSLLCATLLAGVVCSSPARPRARSAPFRARASDGLPLGGAAMLARISSIVGPFPEELLRHGRHAHKYFIDGAVYERDRSGVPYLLQPKATSLRARCHTDDELFLSFVGSLLRIDPTERPTAEQALLHPWLATDQYGWPPPATPEQADAGAHNELGA